MGYLSLIIGCMFAQKTTELLRRIRRYESIGYKVLTVNYSKDCRYGTDMISSHDVITRKAVCVDKLESVDIQVRSGQYNVIIVDEGQFFPDLMQYITAWSDEVDIQIVVAGLDGDSNRNTFGDLLKLIPWAEEVERLTAFCAVCRDGTPAMFSKYMGDNKGGIQVVVGGAELYKPVCRKHYNV